MYSLVILIVSCQAKTRLIKSRKHNKNKAWREATEFSGEKWRAGILSAFDGKKTQFCYIKTLSLV